MTTDIEDDLVNFVAYWLWICFIALVICIALFTIRVLASETERDACNFDNITIAECYHSPIYPNVTKVELFNEFEGIKLI